MLSLRRIRVEAYLILSFCVFIKRNELMISGKKTLIFIVKDSYKGTNERINWMWDRVKVGTGVNVSINEDAWIKLISVTMPKYTYSYRERKPNHVAKDDGFRQILMDLFVFPIKRPDFLLAVENGTVYGGHSCSFRCFGGVDAFGLVDKKKDAFGLQTHKFQFYIFR